MRDYEKNLEEATRQTQSIQEQIHRFQEEKLDHDRKTKETIDKLKEDYEKQYEDLRTQLNQLQSQGEANDPLRFTFAMKFLRFRTELS